MCFNKNIIACLLILGGAACSTEKYVVRPLEPEQSVTAFRTRSTASPGLKEFMVAHGCSDWPLKEWGLSELTLLALYFNPDLRVAQAEARLAASQVAVANSAATATLSPRAEHHSTGSKPWSVGISIESSLGASGRRGAMIEQSEFLELAAERNAGGVAWKIRHEVRTAMLARFEAEQQRQSLADEAAMRGDLLQLLERRRELGLISVHETANARIQLLATEQLRAAADTRVREATHRLAAVLSLPINVVEELPLSFIELAHTPPPTQQAARDALLNRLDIQRLLAEFAAADAAVKVEVAKQHPEISLAPGFLWDQGDNVWSLAVNFVLPRDRSAQIAEAGARRELAAQSFLRLQLQVINESETAAALMQVAQQQMVNFSESAQQQQLKTARVTKQFETGYADRVDLVSAHIENFAAQRNLLDANIRLQKTAALLEDVVQRPLNGFPLTPAEILHSNLARE